MAARPTTLLAGLQRLVAQAESRATTGAWMEMAESLERAAVLSAAWLQPGRVSRADAPAAAALFERLNSLSARLAEGRLAVQGELADAREAQQRVRGTRRSYGYAAAATALPARSWSGSA